MYYHDVPKIEGYTRKQIISFMKLKLSFDNKWILKAFLRLWKNQTDTEKSNYISHGHNHFGFNKLDSLRMTTIYRNYCKEKKVNENEMNYLKRKISKYAAQICSFTDPNKLKKSMDEYFSFVNDKLVDKKNYKFKTIQKEERKPIINISETIV